MTRRNDILTEAPPSADMTPEAQFDRHRSRLFGIAYRMLGQVMDAEDIVQEAFLRWQRTDAAAVADPRAYLATVTTRLCLDQLRSARARREAYVGPWLPEPLLTGRSPGPGEALQQQENLSLAFLLLLERLSPLQRAVFLLREVFDYPYAEVAATVNQSQAYCRQLVRRARQRLDEADPAGLARAAPPPAEQQQQAIGQFLLAVQQADVPRALSLLTEDAVAWSDGGGQVRAALRPVVGADRVVRFYLGLMKQAPADFRVALLEVNGQLALATYDGPALLGLTVPCIAADGRIFQVLNILNPTKLAHLTGPSGGRTAA